ncbi:phage portal protein [Enterobacter sp. WCHEn045836]|uniref:phage portal protein n=1 Tax=Enterobacter sp. WCHEn045836 TaxID=2497434 RepID=UPI000F8370E2|nr:phage portal protein [Enterobacter sp. WCHEn045836]RTP98375.1 phage portal protein [Enterobacter sp. WCHEn045836]
MSKRRKRSRKKSPATTQNLSLARSSVITFGEPEPLLTTGTDYYKIWYDNEAEHWRLPIDRVALSQLVNMNAQHGGIMYARRNMFTSSYLGGGLDHDQIEAGIFDYLLCGDLAILKVRNCFGVVVDLYPLPSLYVRRRKSGDFVVLQEGEPLIYSEDDIIFIRSHDPLQQVYGLPDYIGGIHSALLNSEATIFRRRYYHNGAHMGFILYTNDPNITAEVEEEIKKKIEASKGVGNFSNLYVNIPRGNPEGVKLINIGETSAKDEFSNVKNISAQDVLTAHRFPAGIAGIIPQNAAGLGDPIKTESTYRKNETVPLQRKFIRAVNDDPEVPYHLHLRFDFEEKGE